MNIKETKHAIFDFLAKSPRVSLMPLESEPLLEFIRSCQNEQVLQNFKLELLTSDERLSFSKLRLAIINAIDVWATEQTRHTKIKKFKGSELDKQYLLKKFFVASVVKNHKWLAK